MIRFWRARTTTKKDKYLFYDSSSHLFTHLSMHPPTHPLNHPSIYPASQPLTQQASHLPTCPFSHPVIYPFIYPVSQPSIHPLRHRYLFDKHTSPDFSHLLYIRVPRKKKKMSLSEEAFMDLVLPKSMYP